MASPLSASSGEVLRVYREARHALASGHPDSVRRIIYGVQQRYLDPFVVRKLRLELAAYDVAHGDYQDAERLLKPHLIEELDPVIAPKALLLLTQISLAKHDVKGAKATYEMVQRYFPDADVGHVVFEQLQKASGERLTSRDLLRSPEAHFDFLKGLLVNEKYGAMGEYALYMRDQRIAKDRVAELLFYEGLARYHQYDYLEASSLLSLAMGGRRYELNSWPKCLYYLGQSLRCTHEWDRGAQRFLQVIDSRDGTYAPLASYELCRYYLQSDKLPEYEAALSRFSRDYGHSSSYKKLVWENEWQTLLSLPPEHAFSAFNHIFRSPISSEISTFYRVKGGASAAGIMGAVHRYPMSFYAYEMVSHYFSKGRSLTGASRPTVQYLESFYKAGFGQLARDEASYYLWRQKPLSLDHLYVLASFDVREGKYAEGIRRMRTTFGEEVLQHGAVPKPFIKLLYPRPYWPEISQAAKRFGVDPYLVLAMMRSGSNFDPSYRSEKGLMGLMQLSSQTGRDVSYRLGVAKTPPELLLRPQVSILYGSFYISWLMQEFHGRVHEVLAAYHTDPILAKSWSKQFGSASFDPFVDKVPYLETQAYIRRVMDDYLIYKMIY